MAAIIPDAVFVYGTLKRGQERAKCWPRSPQLVVPASTRGALYDLGPYPALLPGQDCVRGEWWQLAAADMPETLRVLDEIECYGVDDVDLYERRVVECELDDGSLRPAYCYFLANPTAVAPHQRIAPNVAGYCEWP